jgi:hypothetical protein
MFSEKRLENEVTLTVNVLFLRNKCELSADENATRPTAQSFREESTLDALSEKV